MSNYRTLYSLTVEHGYFDNGTCRALRCRISPRGADLWRRRGLLFRQSEPNAWTVLYDSDGAGVDTSSDTLLLEMDITDPAFVLYTRWDGFRPTSAYGLELPVVSRSRTVYPGDCPETGNRRGLLHGTHPPDGWTVPCGAGRYSRELYARVPRSGTQVGIPAGDAHGRHVRHGRPADRGIWRKTDLPSARAGDGIRQADAADGILRDCPDARAVRLPAEADRRRQHFPQACTAEKPSSAASRRVP